MNIAQAKCIPIDAFLLQQGLKPARVRHAGKELWYHSPLRSGDNTPSFKVDTIKNLWFDHGAAEGGNIVKLARELFACSVRDALRHLDRTGLYSPALSAPMVGKFSTRGASRRSEKVLPGNVGLEGEKEKSGGLELVSQGPLTHPALRQYLKTRGIDPDLAARYVSQIDFKAPRSGGNYFALGFPSGEGFEARNALFKGFVGRGKNVTFLEHPGSSLLQVFEGFIDFLSYLTSQAKTQAPGAVIVLNSANLWERALPWLNDARFERVRLYLDNNHAGDKATQRLIESAENPSKVEDMRPRFAGYEDLNDWLRRDRR